MVALGIATLLGSQLEEREPSAPPIPVTVDFSLTGPASGLSRETDTRTATLAALDIRGDYPSQRSNRLSLTRTRVTFDAGSSFDLEILPQTTSERLQGTAAIELSQRLDLGVARDPTTGQFTSLFEGTTTLVNATASGAEVLVGDAAAPDTFTWQAFSAVADDNDAVADLRMASSAFNMMRVVLRAVRIAEDLIDDIENNRTTLEGMGVGSPLTLGCDNGTDDGTGESRLFWRRDAVGSGQGSIGIGDDFEARYENCRRANRDRFLEGVLLASGYVPQTGTGLRSLGMDLDFRSLFDAETMIDIDTTASGTAPRYDGQISLSFTEIPEPASN